jgi:hypothetical protein
VSGNEGQSEWVLRLAKKADPTTEDEKKNVSETGQGLLF